MQYNALALLHCTEVGFTSFLSDGFTVGSVLNPSDEKLTNLTSVHTNASVSTDAVINLLT